MNKDTDIEEKKEDIESIKEKDINTKENLTNSNNNENNNEFNHPKIYNQSRQKYFNVDKIIEKCKRLDNYNLVNYICKIMHESKIKFVSMLFMSLGKDYVLNILEKVLNIENNGGLKQVNNDEKKTTGGVFFTLIKEDPEAKKVLKEAAKTSKKLAKQAKH